MRKDPKHSMIRAIAVAVSIVLFAVVAVGAPITTRADIPFEFEVGGVKLAAGQYHFQKHAFGTGLYVIVDPEGRNHAVLTVPLGDPNGTVTPHLLFNVDGDTYRLAEVWLGHGLGGRTPEAAKAAALAAKIGKSNRNVQVAMSGAARNK